MKAEDAYNFLKPILEEMDPVEKDKLINLMQGNPPKKKKARSKADQRLLRIADKKKRLLKTGLFKN